MKKRTMKGFATLVIVAVWAGACARSGVKPGAEAGSQGLARPKRVLVHDFAISEAEVRENQGAVKRLIDKESGTSQSEREREIGHQAANALADTLVQGFVDLGFPAKRVDLNTLPAEDELLIDGEFLNVDEGNRLRRLVIGFGAGGSKIATQVRAYHGARAGKVLEFTTHADSGKMPGAAATMGAGAAAQGGVTAGAAVANATIAGTKAYRTQTEQMAANSAEEAVAYLSEFFAKQGWITKDQVQKAKRAR